MGPLWPRSRPDAPGTCLLARSRLRSPAPQPPSGLPGARDRQLQLPFSADGRAFSTRATGPRAAPAPPKQRHSGGRSAGPGCLADRTYHSKGHLEQLGANGVRRGGGAFGRSIGTAGCTAAGPRSAATGPLLGWPPLGKVAAVPPPDRRGRRVRSGWRGLGVAKQRRGRRGSGRARVTQRGAGRYRLDDDVLAFPFQECAAPTAECLARVCMSPAFPADDLFHQVPRAVRGKSGQERSARTIVH